MRSAGRRDGENGGDVDAEKKRPAGKNATGPGCGPHPRSSGRWSRRRLPAERRGRSSVQGLFVGGAVVAANGLNAVFQVALARILDPPEYSLLVALVVVTLIAAVPPLAFQAAVAREVAVALEEGRRAERAPRCATPCAACSLGLGVLAFGGAAAAGARRAGRGDAGATVATAATIPARWSSRPSGAASRGLGSSSSSASPTSPSPAPGSAPGSAIGLAGGEAAAVMGGVAAATVFTLAITLRAAARPLARGPRDRALGGWRRCRTRRPRPG